MVTRAEASAFYRAIGFPAFSPRYDPAEVRRRASALLSPHDAGHVHRLATLVETSDPDEYFEVSEFATTPAGLALLCAEPPPRHLADVLVVRPSDNPQRRFRLDIVPMHGYTYHKYRRRLEYRATLLAWVAQHVPLRRALHRSISNIPEERLRRLVHATNALLLYPQTLLDDDSWCEVVLDELPVASLVASLAHWLLGP